MSNSLITLVKIILCKTVSVVFIGICECVYVNGKRLEHDS